MSITFYDLLGIDPGAADPDAAAAALWPNDIINATEGVNVADDRVRIVKWLQSAATFERVRPGADKDVALGAPGAPAGQITLAADLRIGRITLPTPVLYVRSLPNVGIQLLPTGTEKPATVFAAVDGRGHEVLVEGLPVELQLPPGLIEPGPPDSRPPPAGRTPWPGNAPTAFDANDEDSIEIGLDADPHPTTIRTHVRLHLTPGGDVILEPNLPLSFGAATISGFPAAAIHDLLLIPSPNRRDYLEWTRNDIGAFISDPPAAGAIGFRSIMMDFTKPPLKDLADRFRDGSAGVQPTHLELILEDLVFPATGLLPFPIPSHATVGLRRKITDRTSVEQAFSLDDAPFKLKLYSGDEPASGLYLTIDQLLFKSGTIGGSHNDDAPIVELQAAIIWQGDEGGRVGGTVGIADDWTVQLGLTLGDTSPLRLEIASTVVALHAVKGGLSLRRMGDGPDCWQLLGDFSLRSDTRSESRAFRVVSLTGRPLDLVIRDLGWSFGRFSFGSSIAAPDGVQLVFGGVVRLIVEEMGWVEDPGGGTYFSFSGGVAIGFAGGDDRPPEGTRTERDDGNGVGIRFRRLRFLTSHTPAAPPLKLDGIFLKLQYGPVRISGYGYVTDEVDAGYRYQELGFGVSAQFPLLAVTVSLGVSYLKGSKHAVADPSDGFDYFLAQLQVGYIPAGPVGLYAVRALVAYNMAPALDPPGENGESMVLYQWHKDHDGAIDMPRSRNLADWKPQDHSLAIGAGVGFSLNGCGEAFHLGAFVLLQHDEEDTRILVVADLFLLKCPEPIAFAAIEYDWEKEKFGIMAGVDLTVDKFAGDVVPGWMNRIARIGGTIYFGNEPWSLAIGQLADQRTWLGAEVRVPLLDIRLRLALGLQITDGGPKGFGVVFDFAGGANWGIGAFIVYGGLGFVIGTWKTGSDSSGIQAWASIGFKIHVFFVFHFGADIGLDITYLGKHPWYTALTARIHIDTPWFLPDVTFKFEKTWNESLPFDTSTITQPLSGGSAGSPVVPGNDAHGALLVPPNGDGNADPKRLYTFNGLQGVSGAPLQDVHGRGDVPVYAVDADVVLDFTNPLANDAAIATETYDSSGGDAGVQVVQDLTVRYALKSVSIQRSPRFGPGAGTWTDLVAAADTELDLSGGGSVHTAPTVSFRWDADQRADGVLAPKRLIVNSRTPYTLTVGSPRNDEEALGSDVGFPCCTPDRKHQPPRHILEFSEIGIGVRLPGAQRFSGAGGEWWHWAPVAPVTCAGLGGGAASGQTVAFAPARWGVIGSVDFGAPAYDVAFTVDCSLLHGRVMLEGYDGLELLAREELSAGGASSAILRATLQRGFTRAVLRCEAAAHGAPAPAATMMASSGGSQLGGLQVVEVEYRTCADMVVAAGRLRRCLGGDDLQPAVGGGGKLAFLPNHDYAITATIEVRLGHKTAATRTLTLAQPAYFRTKGLVGLNAVANVGDELKPYVAASYPAGGSFLLYREEPVAVAFTEDMSNLLPVDRVPAAGDPPEKAQLMELELGVDKLASIDGPQRLTIPSEDWIDAHAGVVVVFGPPLVSLGLASSAVRRALSADLRVQRYEAVLDAAGCRHEPLHSSEVLLHAPIGPDGRPGAWEPQARLRATVRVKGAPHAQRTRFASADVVAFRALADQAGAPPWHVSDGCMVVGVTLGRHGLPSGRRAFAAFGEPEWNHLRISGRVIPAGGGGGAVAGLAVGVSGSTPVQQGVLALCVGGQLVLVLRAGGVDHELGRAALPAAGPDGGYDLHVTAFDDRVRAQVGEVVVEGDRGAVREGRVALVGTTGARVASVQVDGLDLYYANFTASRYISFADHVAAREPVVAALAAGAMGTAPALTPAGALAAHGAEIATAMTPAADPQARQELFARVASEVGAPLLARCDRLTLTRLTDAGGGSTGALLMESPEPLSFVHDVTLALAQRTWKRVPWWTLDPGVDTRLSAALEQVRRTDAADVLTLPPAVRERLAARGGADRLAQVAEDGSIDLYDLTDPALPLAYNVPVAATAARAALGALADAPAGTIAALRPDGSALAATMAPWWPGGTIHVDTPVPVTVLTNGDETAALVFPAAPLASGTYIMNLVLDRVRWATMTADPQARYRQEATVQLSW
jgi:hypothetical protein